MLFINREKVDEIRVVMSPWKHSAPRTVVESDELEKDIVITQDKIEQVKGLLLRYENSTIKYKNETNTTYVAPEELIKTYFK